MTGWVDVVYVDATVPPLVRELRNLSEKRGDNDAIHDRRQTRLQEAEREIRR